MFARNDEHPGSRITGQLGCLRGSFSSNFMRDHSKPPGRTVFRNTIFPARLFGYRFGLQTGDFGNQFHFVRSAKEVCATRAYVFSNNHVIKEQSQKLEDYGFRLCALRATFEKITELLLMCRVLYEQEFSVTLDHVGCQRHGSSLFSHNEKLSRSAPQARDRLVRRVRGFLFP